MSYLLWHALYYIHASAVWSLLADFYSFLPFLRFYQDSRTVWTSRVWIVQLSTVYTILQPVTSIGRPFNSPRSIFWSLRFGNLSLISVAWPPVDIPPSWFWRLLRPAHFVCLLSILSSGDLTWVYCVPFVRRNAFLTRRSDFCLSLFSSVFAEPNLRARWLSCSTLYPTFCGMSSRLHT